MTVMATMVSSIPPPLPLLFEIGSHVPQAGLRLTPVVEDDLELLIPLSLPPQS